MNARWRERADLPLRPMRVEDVDAVMAIEAACYPFPWSRGNFIDSLAAGYPTGLLHAANGELLGYFVALVGVGELHLLNITVASEAQGRGHASVLMAALRELCTAHNAAQLWLEVRRSNDHAQAVYQHLGFATVGLRKGYYPAPFGRREDAVVMSWPTSAAARAATRSTDRAEARPDALD